MKSNRWAFPVIIILSLAGPLLAALLSPPPSSFNLILCSLLVIIASLPRLQFPGALWEIVPVNPIVLTSIWILGPYAWIPAIVPSCLSFVMKKATGKTLLPPSFPHPAHLILTTISSGFVYLLTGGVPCFSRMELPLVLPLLASLLCFSSLNLLDLGNYATSGEQARHIKYDFRKTLIDLAFVPVSILMVLILGNLHYLYLLLIIIPFFVAFFFLRKAFRDYEEKDDLKVFYNFTQLINRSLNLEELLNKVTEELLEVSGSKGSLLALFDEEKKEIVLNVSRGVFQELAFVPSPQLKERVLQFFEQRPSSQIVTCNGLLPEACSGSEGELCATPLMEEKKIIGFILSLKERFTDKDHQHLTIIAAQASTAIANGSLYRKAVRANEELQEAQAQLIQSSKIAAVGQLAAGVAHELNNPLGAVLTNFQTLTPFLGDREDLKKILKEAEEAVLSCKTTIEKLLRYSRQAGLGDLKMELRAVIVDTLELLEDQCALANIEVTTDLHETPSIVANPNHIGQVVTNLFINACDAILEAKPSRGSIEVKSFEEDGRICFSIGDNGTGIPEEILDDLFKPFFTTREIGRYAGLGLSISSDIITRYGGTIEVKTKIREGSLFTVRLPIPTPDTKGPEEGESQQ
jgi:signal transduction histidine kinase